MELGDSPPHTEWDPPPPIHPLKVLHRLATEQEKMNPSLSNFLLSQQHHNGFLLLSILLEGFQHLCQLQRSAGHVDYQDVVWWMEGSVGKQYEDYCEEKHESHNCNNINNKNNIGNGNSSYDKNNEYYDRKNNCSLERYFSESLSLSAIIDIYVIVMMETIRHTNLHVIHSGGSSSLSSASCLQIHPTVLDQEYVFVQAMVEMLKLHVTSSNDGPGLHPAMHPVISDLEYQASAHFYHKNRAKGRENNNNHIYNNNIYGYSEENAKVVCSSVISKSHPHPRHHHPHHQHVNNNISNNEGYNSGVVARCLSGLSGSSSSSSSSFIFTRQNEDNTRRNQSAAATNLVARGEERRESNRSYGGDNRYSPSSPTNNHHNNDYNNDCNASSHSSSFLPAHNTTTRPDYQVAAAHYHASSAQQPMMQIPTFVPHPPQQQYPAYSQHQQQHFHSNHHISNHHHKHNNNQLQYTQQYQQYQCQQPLSQHYLPPLPPSSSIAPLLDHPKKNKKSFRMHPAIFKVVMRLREYSMGLIFPPHKHDQILVCLYVALCTFAPRPVVHQRLIDLAMALKDSGYLPEVEYLSKSKVRGVLAILKQAELVGKCSGGGLGEQLAVQLYLVEGVDRFEKLREGHDRYLQAYMVENQLHVPEELLGEVMWQVSAEERRRRVEQLEGLAKVLESVAVDVLASKSFGDGNGDDGDEEVQQEDQGEEKR